MFYKIFYCSLQFRSRRKLQSKQVFTSFECNPGYLSHRICAVFFKISVSDTDIAQTVIKGFRQRIVIVNNMGLLHSLLRTTEISVVDIAIGILYAPGRIEVIPVAIKLSHAPSMQHCTGSSVSASLISGNYKTGNTLKQSQILKRSCKSGTNAYTIEKHGPHTLIHVVVVIDYG